MKEKENLQTKDRKERSDRSRFRARGERNEKGPHRRTSHSRVGDREVNWR